MPKRKPPKRGKRGEFKKPENFGKTLNSFIIINLGKLEELAEGKKEIIESLEQYKQYSRRDVSRLYGFIRQMNVIKEGLRLHYEENKKHYKSEEKRKNEKLRERLEDEIIKIRAIIGYVQENFASKN